MQSPKISTPLSEPAPSPQSIRLRDKAEEMEAAFLSEMLAHSGLDTPVSSFGGGVGEEHFSSFLRNEQARLLAGRGDFGIAESIFRALSKAEEMK